MSSIVVVHVRYNSSVVRFFAVLCKQKREMTKFCVVRRACTTTGNFLNFYLEFNAAFHVQFRDSFAKRDKLNEFIRVSRDSQVRYKFIC